MRDILSRIIAFEHSNLVSFSDEEKELAHQRAKVCSQCEFLAVGFDPENEINYQYCPVCGCKLAVKLHKPSESCDAGKWDSVELKTRTFSKPKITKLL